MTVFRWDPFKNIVTLQDRINRLFDESFPRTPGGDEEMADCAWRPLVDIYENEDGVVIQVDLPGVSKADTTVEVKDNRLTIHGSRQMQSSVKDEQYYRRERICGSFQRSFALRYNISPDTIKASFKDGVLSIVIPRPSEEKPKKVSITID